jgi:hypothetical protein
MWNNTVHKLTLNSFQNGTESFHPQIIHMISPAELKVPYSHGLEHSSQIIQYSIDARILSTDHLYSEYLKPDGQKCGKHCIDSRMTNSFDCSSTFPLDVRRRMIQMFTQTTLHSATPRPARFAQCCFNNTRLKDFKYMDAKLRNAGKLNIRGWTWTFMLSTAAEAGSYRKVKLFLSTLLKKTGAG